MAHFPVSNSNLSALHVGYFVKDQYGFNGDIECSLIRAGINDTYHVACGNEKYVFRIYSLNWRSPIAIEEELKLLALLKDNSLSISFPITDSKGGFIQKLNAPEGDRYGVLFSFADGEKIQVYPPELHYNIGELMAKMHLVTQGVTLQRVTYTPQVLLLDSLEKLKPFLSQNSEEWLYMVSTQKLLLDKLSNVNTAKLRQGAVHLDIWFDNLNINKENKITVFDFDFCGNGWLCLDIAYYMLQLYNIERDEKECQAKLDAFFAGYQSITPINEEEKNLLPALGVSLYFFYLGIQCQRYDNWSNSFLSENYLKRFINALVKRYFDIHKLGN